MENTKKTSKKPIAAAELPLSLWNDKCRISYDPITKDASGTDLEDLHNLPKF